VRRAFPRRRIRLVAATDDEPRGLVALRRLAAAPPPSPARPVAPARSRARRARAEAPPWLEQLAPAGTRVLAFVGKGGVGKTSAAAAVALGLAARRPEARLLLLSTDPAHSLGDVLAIPLGDDERPVAGAPRLVARELDAGAAFAVRRERYEKAVDELFDGVLRGSRFDVAYDRRVVRELMDLAPPGLDELFGVLTLVDSLLRTNPPPHDMVIVDTAPTGHALRLLAMPAGALDWVHALLAILLKYRAIIGLGELASDLLEVARELRDLAALLRDAGRTRVVAVTRAAALPRLETARLLRGLRRLNIPVGAVVINAVTPPGCSRCRRVVARESHERAALAAAARSALGERCAMISAPAESPPPGGVDGLRDWLGRWQWRE
jgi:arsenite-transporting ATPase